MVDSSYAALYRDSWRAQNAFFRTPPIHDWLLDCATPVMAFGRWRTARIATAGLNPSECEFLSKDHRQLPPDKRRFLHRVGTDLAEPLEVETAEAQRLAEGYFELGNAFTDWFNGFKPFLEALDLPYESGLACHTDYVSPFTTTKGIGSTPARVQATLQTDGLRRWKAMLDLLPECRIVVGMGAGWRVVPATLEFAAWEPIRTPLDAKGGMAKSERPHVLYSIGRLARGPVHVFWWRPNRGDPLSYLDADEKRWFGRLVGGRAGL